MEHTIKLAIDSGKNQCYYFNLCTSGIISILICWIKYHTLIYKIYKK